MSCTLALLVLQYISCSYSSHQCYWYLSSWYIVLASPPYWNTNRCQHQRHGEYSSTGTEYSTVVRAAHVPVHSYPCLVLLVVYDKSSGTPIARFWQMGERSRMHLGGEGCYCCCVGCSHFFSRRSSFWDSFCSIVPRPRSTITTILDWTWDCCVSVCPLDSRLHPYQYQDQYQYP